MSKLFTDFPHSYATYSSPPHLFQKSGSPQGQNLNQNSFVCRFSFWFRSKLLMGIRDVMHETLCPSQCNSSSSGNKIWMNNQYKCDLFWRKCMWFFSLSSSRFLSILCYLSWGSWNLICLSQSIPPPPGMLHLSALCPISCFSRPTADCLFF